MKDFVMKWTNKGKEIAEADLYLEGILCNGQSQDMNMI